MKKWWKNNWWLVLTITLLVGTTVACFVSDDEVYVSLYEGMVVDKKYYPATGGFLFYEGERFVLVIYNEIDGKGCINRIYVPEYEYRKYKIKDWWRRSET